MKRRLLTLPLIALATVLAFSSVTSASPSAAAQTIKINVGNGGGGIAANDFFPDSVTIHVGDTIHFVNPYNEPHTTTYLPAGQTLPPLVVPGPDGPPQFGINPDVATPTFTSQPVTFDATKELNSGVMFKDATVDVVFPAAGTFKFLCAFHPGMELDLDVVPTSSTADTQATVDARAQSQTDAILAQGRAAAAAITSTSAKLPDGSTEWKLQVGGSAGQADLMQFFAPSITVQAGDTVTWTNPVPTPHTVSFLSGAALPALITPITQPSGPPFLAFNPQVLLPAGGNTYDGTGYVNSGFLATVDAPTNTYSLKFTTPGTYSYVCILHADQGMAGTVTVTGAPAPAPSPTPPSGIVAPSTGTGPSGAAGAGWLMPVLLLGLAGGALLLAGVRGRRSA